MAPRAEQLTPEMRQRYGLDSNPWPGRIAAAAVILGCAAALAFFAVRLTDGPTDARLLVWQQPQPDRLDITFDVTKPAGLTVACVLRAQDAQRVDLGYAQAELRSAQEYVQLTYQMRVIGPASYVEILACGPSGEPLRVPPPAFPPGVVPPEQPWTAPASDTARNEGG